MSLTHKLRPCKLSLLLEIYKTLCEKIEIIPIRVHKLTKWMERKPLG